MEIQLTEERRAQLEAVAKAEGKSPAALAGEAVVSYLEHRKWITEGVREGRAAAARGDLHEHDEVGDMLTKRYGAVWCESAGPVHRSKI